MSQKKTANGAGSVEWRKGVAFVRIALPRGPGEPLQRKRLPIVGADKMTPSQVRREAAKLAADVRAGRIIIDEKPRRGAAPSVSAVMTVRQIGEKWTSGELVKTYGNVNRLRVKATAEIDAWMLKAHAYEVKTRGASGPVFGDLPVMGVTTDDVSAVMAAHPRELRAKTRGDTYQRLRRLFDLAIFPLRIRKEGSNPVTRYLRPERDPEKLFCFLYPVEALSLLRGTNADGKVVVPLGRRVLYALATYTGQRKGSLYALQWKHVDVKHGTLASFRTKTGRAQYFVGDPGLMALLRAWRALRGAPRDDEPIVRDEDVGYDRKRLATALRDDLKAVGVTRALLFEETSQRVPVFCLSWGAEFFTGSWARTRTTTTCRTTRDASWRSCVLRTHASRRKTACSASSLPRRRDRVGVACRARASTNDCDRRLRPSVQRSAVGRLREWQRS